MKYIILIQTLFIFLIVFIFVYYYTNYLISKYIDTKIYEQLENNKQKIIDEINKSTFETYQEQKSNFEDFLGNIF